jgi:hypothetical protein
MLVVKNYLLLILFAVSITTAGAQSFGKNLAGVSVAIDQKHPKEFLYDSLGVQIRIADLGMTYITFEVRNSTDSGIDLLWDRTHLVVTEETIPIADVGDATARALGLEVNESNSVSPPTHIASNSKVTVRAASKKGILFDYAKVNKYFKENGKMPDDRISLYFASESGGKRVVTIPIQVYTGRIKKALKN